MYFILGNKTKLIVDSNWHKIDVIGNTADASYLNL